VTGDLARRYVLPALEVLEKEKKLPEKFKMIGITRGEDPNFFHMDVMKREDYESLNAHLLEVERGWGESAQRLFYLLVPPEASKSIIEFLGTSSLSKSSQKKLLLEKPFGVDLKSAKALGSHISKYFLDQEIYRVDHYMHKEVSENIIKLRQSNDLFEKELNKDFIKSIDIVASEKIGIERLANFYEKVGALRDYVQSHLLEMASFILMDTPKEKEELPRLRKAALEDLCIVCDINKNDCVKRAQYGGYREEIGNLQSITETFVSVSLCSSAPAWRGVPVRLTTGKALNEKRIEIRINYKNVPALVLTEPPSSTNAYERVLVDAINSDQSMFASIGEVFETWRILDPVQEAWKNSKSDIKIYPRGSTVEEVLKI